MDVTEGKYNVELKNRKKKEYKGRGLSQVQSEKLHRFCGDEEIE